MATQLLPPTSIPTQVPTPTPIQVDTPTPSRPTLRNENVPGFYGAPLRLMVPFRYGYKSAKAIVRIEFAKEEGKGYWSSVAPYTTHGNIQRGNDHPLDLEGTREIKNGGEIFYPDGIESKD